MGGWFKREGIYVYTWLIHVEVWRTIVLELFTASKTTSKWFHDYIFFFFLPHYMKIYCFWTPSSLYWEYLRCFYFYSQDLRRLYFPGGPQFSSVQSLSRVRLVATPWIEARQVVKNSSASARVVTDRGSIPELGKSLEEGMATTPVYLPEESHGQRSLVGPSP